MCLWMVFQIVERVLDLLASFGVGTTAQRVGLAEFRKLELAKAPSQLDVNDELLQNALWKTTVDRGSTSAEVESN